MICRDCFQDHDVHGPCPRARGTLTSHQRRGIVEPPHGYQRVALGEGLIWLAIALAVGWLAVELAQGCV